MQLPLAMNKVNKNDIFNKVWQACDTFRGTIDPDQYKNYVLTMLFVKYISEVWKEKKASYTAKYQGDMTRVERSLRNERFYVPDDSLFDQLYKNRNAINIGEQIDIGLTALEDANRTKLEGVFRNISFNSDTLGQTVDRNRRLKNLLVDFAALDLQPSHLAGNDVIGDAYEYLISRFASDAGKKAGEFYTPAEVSELLARLVAPQPGSRICDPACGSGSLLIKVARQVGSTNFSLYGQENNGSTWALCRMNMFLHEMDTARIEWADTLNNPRLVENDELMKFHIVVANPPFSLDKWGADKALADKWGRFHRGVPPKSKGDFAFISHMIETTYADTGRVGVIVPHGVLFRGSSEGQIRRQLIEENLLEAVIGLPGNLFYGTGIPAAILLFNRAKGLNRDVLFVDASRQFEAGKNQNRLRESDLQLVQDTYCQFQATPSTLDPDGKGTVLADKYAYRATPADLRENDFNLNIPRYVDTFEEETPIDLRATQTEIKRLKDELIAVENQMQAYLTELGFAD